MSTERSIANMTASPSSPFTVTAFYGTPRKKFRQASPSNRPLFSTLHRKTSELFEKVDGSSGTTTTRTETELTSSFGRSSTKMTDLGLTFRPKPSVRLAIDTNAPLPLKNLGNTCYVNSIVQCLFSLSSFMKPFKHAFESVLSGDEHINKSDARYKIAYAFTQLYDTWKRIQMKANASANTCGNVVCDDVDSDKDDECDTCVVPTGADNLSNLAVTTPVHDPLKAAHLNGAGNSQLSVPNSESLVPLTADSQIDEKLNDLKLAVGERSTQFNSTHQQDASEFFYHVIDAIQEFFEDIEHVSDEQNPVTSTFEFELDYFVTCVKCGHMGPADTEKIRTLPLAMPKDASSQMCNGKSPSSSVENQPSSSPSDDKENKQVSGTSEISLQSALVNYFRDDHMEYKCSQDGCDSKEKTRKCMIKKLPRVLFMTLARYSHTGQKNLEEIKAPFEIYVPTQDDKCLFSSDSNNISIKDDNKKYQLVAVVCHLGPSLNAGHYTSFVYNQENATWYSCDDDAVTKADPKQVEREARCSGYCFFYAHKSSMDHPQVSSSSLSTTHTTRIW